ncbi:MAG TPA: SAM hydroxide adenosyltransferase, partial [Flavobacteriaceae bacterium]|nr:SAM hydroxide adenosyltransferase [Flavobacteriaceae bacterium]
YVNSEQNQIVGHVVYIDNYGNVVSNISKKFFETVGKGRDFVLSARSINFEKIHETYSQAINFELSKEKREEDGKKLALFNSSGYIELAIYKSNPHTVGSASTLFGLNLMDSITLKFL